MEMKKIIGNIMGNITNKSIKRPLKDELSEIRHPKLSINLAKKWSPRTNRQYGFSLITASIGTLSTGPFQTFFLAKHPVKNRTVTYQITAPIALKTNARTTFFQFGLKNFLISLFFMVSAVYFQPST